MGFLRLGFGDGAKQVFEQLGYFDPKFGNYADVDMWLRIAREYDVAYVNVPLMNLMPKDPTRFYAFVHWKVAFWTLGMHVINLRRYRQCLPEFVEEMANKYRPGGVLYSLSHVALPETPTLGPCQRGVGYLA